MSDFWDRFREKPGNRVDEYVFALAVIASEDAVRVEEVAGDLCPDFSEREISDLVNLNMDMVRPPDAGLSFEQWSNAWNTALRYSIRAVGADAKEALFQRVLAPGRDSTRNMYFSCLLNVLMHLDGAVREDNIQRLAAGLRGFSRSDLFETTDLNDWMRDLGRGLPEGGEAVLDVLKAIWFSADRPELMRIEDYSDADHDAFSLASATVYLALWFPGYAEYISDDLKRIACNDFFPVTLNPDDPEDHPEEGAGRQAKLQAIVGASFAILERDPGNGSWLKLCLSYAYSPAEDTRDAFAQWRPVVVDPFPRATALIDQALE